MKQNRLSFRRRAWGALLRLLMGELPDGGAISAPVGFSYFPYPVEKTQRLTEEIILEIAPELPEKFRERKQSFPCPPAWGLCR